MANHLKDEKSPYLLQHADNPVDWYPWCDEAFEKAKEEDKPVFLSIGYSTCHWCHVMAHESFEDPDVAKLMNDTFVNIKVDREERPDIDDIYMTVCQMATGRGGWPLTVLLTPDQKPFFAATYLPKESRGRQVGMLDLIPQVQDMWNNNREEALDSAEDVMQSLQQSSKGTSGDELSEDTLNHAVQRMTSQFDQTYGGFGNEPKFPSPHNFLFLLRYAHRTGEKQPLEMVKTSLKTMRQGGVYDQVGYGFHRYSTDRQWKLPHFEKMLYDQALLAEAFLETYQITDDPFYKQTAEEIFEYVLRDMTAPEGGFYSAEDADSEGGEGVFYQWTLDELQDVLTHEEAEFARKVFNVREEGNFQEEASGERTGRNVLHPGHSREEMADALDLSPEEFNETYETIRKKLFEEREKRSRPHLDDKVLTSWNGLMISALAKGGAILNESEYLSAARDAASFVLDSLRKESGRLLHRYRDGDAAIEGNADDYAFFTRGLIDLYNATSEVSYLRNAVETNDVFLNHFWDDESGGFYFTPDDGEELITRKKSIKDGAKPSSNSMAYRNLLTLGRLTGDPDLEHRAVELERAFADSIRKTPVSFTMFLCGLNFRVGMNHEIVVAGPADNEETERYLQQFRQAYLPGSVLLYRPIGKDAGNEMVELAPFTEHQEALNGSPAIYVCTDYACEQPTSDLEKAFSLLGKSERNERSNT